MEKLLLQDGEGKFIFNQIDTDTVNEANVALQSIYNRLEDLHERYLSYIEAEDDPTQAEYLKNVIDMYSAIKRKYSKYRSSSEVVRVKADNEAKFTILLEEVLMLKTSVDGKDAAAEVIINAAK